MAEFFVYARARALETKKIKMSLTGFPIRFLMWNMPYHAEHHLCPAVPFHQLPALHRLLQEKLAHVAAELPGGEPGRPSILCNAG